jgi:hypothetical protein
MRAGKIVLVIVGAIIALIGLTAGAAGAAALLVHATQRDDAGYYNTPTERFETVTAALVGNAELDQGDVAGWDPIGEVKVRVESYDQGPVFVGIGPRDQVEQWLAGAAYERVIGVRFWPSRIDTELVFGTEPIGPPADQGFWAATASGPGTQTLTWDPQDGDWSLVVMNSDASPGVAADVRVGAESDLLLPLGVGLGILALVLLAAAIVLMLVAISTGRGGGPGTVGGAAAQGPAGVPVTGADHTNSPDGGQVPDSPYPVRLDARLDAPLSRWLWLVKWFLAIPHLILLALLWVAFGLLTFVAGIVILVTGRYPRGIFEFNVGVLRWSWRVGYYAFSALGTDRYPPFRLEPDPSYPADLDVPYPERLSRGLVLVKWWLLAIPHYLVVAVYTGGGSGWFGWDSDGMLFASGAGLIGILVIVAVVVLAFTGRYPRPVFDFVLGLDRWCYRVAAYAALMRDEYPPFRLDTGGTDPGTRRVAASPGHREEQDGQDQ